MYFGAQIDVQLKCTSQDFMADDGLHFPLEAKYFNSLANPRRYNPVILVVVHVPYNPSEWISYPNDDSESGLTLTRSAYWVNLAGQSTTNSSTKTVVLPKENVFGVESLLQMLARVGNGGRP